MTGCRSLAYPIQMLSFICILLIYSQGIGEEDYKLQTKIIAHINFAKCKYGGIVRIAATTGNDTIGKYIELERWIGDSNELSNLEPPLLRLAKVGETRLIFHGTDFGIDCTVFASTSAEPYVVFPKLGSDTQVRVNLRVVRDVALKQRNLNGNK